MNKKEFLGYEVAELEKQGAIHTAREIASQPELWEAVFRLVEKQKSGLDEFLSRFLDLPASRVILTGAGSSAFIGDSIQGIVQLGTRRLTQAIATTDLVTNPELYFLPELPILMISFARSGNSPESIEAVRLSNVYCKNVFHLVITCNKDGDLARYLTGNNSYCFILPENANDKSLAMTGSFTAMMLAAILIVEREKLKKLIAAFENTLHNSRNILLSYAASIRDIARNAFERVVFLGSGPLLGIARECHLKLQELTDGIVICKFDSFLGFRHGPRAVINDQALVVYLFSENDNVFMYEKDLALSIAQESSNVPVICFGRNIPGITNSILNIELHHKPGQVTSFYNLLAVLVGQLFGFYKSLDLALQPDNPSKSGAISRVVRGVTIYPSPSVFK